MPTLPQAQTIVQYQTNGTQTQFSFAFYAPLPTDIVVYSQASTALPNPEGDILALNVDYTVTYNNDPTTGGYITMTLAPANDNYLTIVLQVAASLTTNFAAAQNFNGANLDAALDRLLLLCQQNQNYALYRNLSYVINTYLPNATPFTQLPTLGNMQIWQGTGSGVVAVTLQEAPDSSTLRSQLALASSSGDGASIVGWWDQINLLPSTVDVALDKLSNVYTDTGTANNIVVSAPNYGTPNVGSILKIKVAANNLGTVATTIQLNGGTPLAVSLPNLNSFLPSKALLATHSYELQFDGSVWQLVNASEFCYGGTAALSGSVMVPGFTTQIFIFNQVIDDPNNIFNILTYSFTPKMAGWYQVNSNAQVTSTVTEGVGYLIYKNNAVLREICQTTITANQIEGLTGSGRVYCNGTSDSVQIYISNGGSTPITSSNECYFELFYLGNS